MEPAEGTAKAGGAGMNREQMKKMSEADKEMELRANRAKALLAERHIGLRTNQVRADASWLCYCMRLALQQSAHITCTDLQKNVPRMSLMAALQFVDASI